MTAAGRESDLLRAIKGLAVFLGGVVATAATVVTLHDRLWPPVTARGGEVVAADLLDADVPFQAYVQQHPEEYPDPAAALRKVEGGAAAHGAVVEVIIRLQGLRGRSCSSRYTLYRLPLEPVRQGEALASCTSQFQDNDEGGWAAWIPLTGQPAGRYFVRFDLYDEHGLLIGPGKATRAFAWQGG